MSAQRIMRRQLGRDGGGESCIQPAPDIDSRKLRVFVLGISR